MTIKEIRDILAAQTLVGEDLLDNVVHTACAADMMSDVLAYGHHCSILLTGLCNPQVVRTAEMLDILCLVFVRNKMPDAKTLELAKTKGIVVLSTPILMFQACGLLYEKGLIG